MKTKEVIEMKYVWWMVVVLVLLLGLRSAGLIALGAVAPSSSEPKIIFVGKDRNAYVAGIDGKNSRKITSSGVVSAARWLDADAVVALVRHGTDDPDKQGQDIWLVQATDKDKKTTRLTKSGMIGSFACSPDGKWVVFTGEPGLCRINRDGSGFRVLNRSEDPDLRGDLYEVSAFLTVAKDTVFYSGISYADTVPTYKIWKLDSQGKQDRCVYYTTRPSHEIEDLVSSRDGRRIIFSVLDRDRNTFYVREINTSDFRIRTLAELKGAGWDLCSLMSGEKQILLVRATDSRADVFVLDLKPGAKPELLIRDAFDADVWYSGK